MCLFHFYTCFEQPSAHHQENQLYQYIIWYVSLCVGGHLVCRSLTCIPEIYGMITYTSVATCAGNIRKPRLISEKWRACTKL